MTTTMKVSDARITKHQGGIQMSKDVYEAVGRLEQAIKEKKAIKGDDVDIVTRCLRAEQNERFFPVLRYGVVPWWIGKVAHGRWLAKQRQVGNSVAVPITTVEGVAQRGGYTTVEMDEYASGWRQLSRPYVPTRRDFPFVVKPEE